MEVGFKDILRVVPVPTVKVVERVTPANTAETVAVVDWLTASVFTVKVAEVCPARTVTEAGTVTETVLDVNVTIDPLAGAGAARVIVPVALLPPITEVGKTVRLDRLV